MKDYLKFFELLYVLLLSDKRLDEQNIMNNSKVMVLKESEPEGQKAIREVEEKNRSHSESVQRTQKGFQILSERGETVSTWSYTSTHLSFNIAFYQPVHLHRESCGVCCVKIYVVKFRSCK